MLCEITLILLFFLSILEYINITDLSKEEARKLILEQEQHYIDLLEPVYNINPIARSRLGSLHTEESKAKMRIPKTEETKAKMNLAQKGKLLTEKHKRKISLAMSKKIYIYSKDCDSNEMKLQKYFDSFTEAAEYYWRPSFFPCI